MRAGPGTSLTCVPPTGKSFLLSCRENKKCSYSSLSQYQRKGWHHINNTRFCQNVFIINLISEDENEQTKDFWHIFLLLYFIIMKYSVIPVENALRKSSRLSSRWTECMEDTIFSPISTLLIIFLSRNYQDEYWISIGES